MIIQNLTKRYNQTLALDNISLELKEGEIIAVLGESGAGKTTLLSAVAGLIGYEGEIDGVSGEKRMKRKECSYLFQETLLLPNLTVEGNLKLVLPKAQWDKIDGMLERVGLAHKKAEKPSSLSGGEKQRAAIARAFLLPHDTLLLDEPFSSLDLALKKSLLRLVYELWQETGGSILFVTHDVHEAVLLAHRAVVLKKGKLVSDIPIPAPMPRDFFASFEEEKTLVKILTDEA